MMRRVVLASLLFACSPANPTPEIVKPAPLGVDAGPVGLGFATPAKWALTFSQRWRTIASLELDSGSTLHAGDGGERWIESASGTQDGAAVLAPERLVGIQKADNVFRFVGASGAVYVAHEALGALTKSGVPVEGARQVAVGKSAILVVDGKGDLQRSTDGGRTWAKTDIPNREGVVVDVAMLGEKGIVVIAPQRFYGTKDDGVTWTVAKSPGIGVQSVVARDGALWVDGVEENMRFDPAWNTFSSGASSAHASTRKPYTKQTAPVTVNRIDGRRAIQITGNGTERIWSIAMGDAGSLAKPRKVDEFDGCELVDAAMRGDDVVVSCDARGTIAGGIDKDATAPVNKYSYGRTSGSPDGGSLGWITRILRSTDGGRSFRDETTIEGGITQRGDAGIALGPDDFVYVGRRCAQGYNPQCIPSRVRASKSAGFSELPGEDDNQTGGHIRFAVNGGHSSAYSIGMRESEAFLYRWKSGSAIPEAIGRLAAAIDPASATLGLDEDGTVRGFARSGRDALAFSYKEGGTISTTTLSIAATHGAFAGQHGFVITASTGTADAKAYESLDGGKTWGLVGAPAFMTTIEACTSFGCVTDRGLRWGWDAPSGTADGGASATKPVARTQYARPLRCSAKDKWIELGGGNLPNASYVDHGSARWVLPTRDKDGKIAVVTSKRGEPTTKTTSVQLMGAPPGAPKFGSATTMHVQDGGVVAVRYVYTRERKSLSGRYNPVDAQLTWWRDGGKIARATANKNPPFRVNKDPQGGYDRDQQPMYSELPELVSLSPKGVYFHPASTFEEDDSGGDPKRLPLFLLRDDGKTDKVPLPEGVSNDSGSGVMASIDGTNMLLSRNPENWTTTNLTDGKRTFYSVLGGLGDDDGVVDLVTLGGKAAFAATLRDPARAWLIALKPESDLGAASGIATQKSLGDVPKACDGAPATDPTAYRIDAPWVLGARRPVIVDSDGASIILATDRAEIRGTTSSPDACVAAFDAFVPAQDGDHDFSALVFTDDLAHSLLFRADSSTWPAPIAVRTMECQYQAGPLPEELETTEGFVTDERHSAVTHKRY